MKKIVLGLVLLMGLSVVTVSCKEKSNKEKVEEAIEDAGDAIEEAADEVGDKVEEAADEVEDTIEEIKEEVDNN
ncbi:hypothetical protein SAMN04487906_2977 [Zhouia amylolytica]|uniref:YtxH domain-containing protein n=2 Tax=Zhouia amylolytica TaxID=376730 RepID=W2UK29_9FLAO|nr:YtxH domain-containing protein [Zhouia amylolytica]ETN94353.1 hypothetical protein P278_22950 [Zhouia amylolytica AD3]MCQ0110417.1 YtxH domain-containing protein [Zhouia amylolytica]SFT11249.1 hypothetical protein SAMN04487906_2977 [Zhouia amylolytica]